jgi:hypothetical protein
VDALKLAVGFEEHVGVRGAAAAVVEEGLARGAAVYKGSARGAAQPLGGRAQKAVLLHEIQGVEAQTQAPEAEGNANSAHDDEGKERLFAEGHGRVAAVRRRYATRRLAVEALSLLLLGLIGLVAALGALSGAHGCERTRLADPLAVRRLPRELGKAAGVAVLAARGSRRKAVLSRGTVGAGEGTVPRELPRRTGAAGEGPGDC